ncbi:NfeD family protein [Psychrosphaera sp. B3R10]|uniref:NfeD family protein n=1 Tax=unclassified Psychrosphaera TaxID=2641570 RepID=UPI001C081E4C|nr:MULTISPECIES: NfeD family protein [unclassified Psychrosphaera]MBU2880442.1 NfeD family protein [Psychrosphaera sp. I2R16]MBU2991457.1 NfeD family protein [Psychrosphaera sp. B3R10]
MTLFSETYQVLLAAGLILAAIDILAMGFATFFLTILGLATILTGTLVFFGLIGEGMLAISLSIALFSIVCTLLLYKPLKLLQSNSSAAPAAVHSDLTDMTFILEDDVGPNLVVNYHYSGIDWKLKANEHIGSGTLVAVYKLEVGEMYVQPFTD